MGVIVGRNRPHVVVHPVLVPVELSNDIAQTGEAPPIFAQAAGPRLSYLAFEPPAPQGEAILVADDSHIATVADLKGKKIALNKGSNVHYLLVKALEKAGLAYEDVETVFLPPADARPAFETKAVDAWAIWDPFLASAQSALGAKILTNAEGLAPNYQFYLGDRSFLEGNAEAARAKFDKLLNFTSAESAALQILAAVEGNKRRVLVGLDAKFLDKLVRVLGSWYQPIITAFAKRDMLG